MQQVCVLDKFLSRFVKEGGVVFSFGVFLCRTVVWGDDWVGLILGRTWEDMFEARQCVFNVPWHGDVYFLFFVIPVYGETNLSFDHPLLGVCVVLFEGVHEVFSVLLVHILNPEIVHA